MARFSPYDSGSYIGGSALNYRPPTNLGLTPDETQPFARTFGAMLNLESPILSYSINSAFGLNEDIQGDPAFNSLDRMVQDSDLHYYQVLKDAKNEDHYNRLKLKADWESDQRQTLANVGITENLLAGLAVGMVDPLNLAVGAFTGGAGTLGGAAFRSIASALVVTGTNEAFLQQTQVTRTAEEAAMNVVGDMIFSTALGMGGYGIARKFGANPEKIKNGLYNESEMAAVDEHGLPFGGGRGPDTAKNPGDPGWANDLQARPSDEYAGTISIIDRPAGVLINEKTGKSTGASFNENDWTIYYDKMRLEEMYDEHSWRTPDVEGVEPLQDSNFPTYEHFHDFVMEHEYHHTRHRQMEGEADAVFENRINAHSLRTNRLNSRMGVDHRPITLAEHEASYNNIKNEFGADAARQMKREGAFGRAFDEESDNFIPEAKRAGPDIMPTEDVIRHHNDEIEAEKKASEGVRTSNKTEHGLRHNQLLHGMAWSTKLVKALGLENLKFSPMLWGMASHNAATRLYTILLVPTPVNVGNTLGVATAKSVETFRNDRRGEIVAALNGVEKSYMELRLGKELSEQPSAGAVLKEAALSQFERVRKQNENDPLRYIHIFNKEVSRAVRSGDTHDNPHVAKAAKAIREAINKVTKDAQDLGLFKGDTAVALDLMGAQSYLPRMILHDVIDNNIEEFINVVVAWQRAHISVIPDNLDDKLAIAIRSGNAEQHTAIIRKQALRLARKLSGVEDYDIEATDIAGSMKGRSIWVDDNVLAGDNTKYGGSGHSFLENDVNAIMKTWMPQIHTDIELTKQFGSVDMALQFQNVRAMAVRDAEKSGESVFTKTIDKGDKEPLVVQTTKNAEKDIEKLSAMRDQLRGVYALSSDPLAISSRSARLLTDFTNWALMGNVMVSSIPDAGRLVMVNKLHAFKTLQLAFTDFQKLRESMGDMRDTFRVGFEMALSSRAQSLVHQGDIPRYSAMERATGRGTEINFIVNGLNPWNAVIKQAAGIATASRMIDDFKRYAAFHGDKRYGSNLKPLSNVEMTKLSAAGVNQDIVKRILALHDKYGERHRGLEMPNASHWDMDDPDFDFDIGEALLSFRSIIQEEVDRQIVTPGAGDIPLWIRKSPMADIVEKSLLGKRMSAEEAAKFGRGAEEGDRPGQFGKYGTARKEAAALYPALGHVFGIYKSFIAGSWSRVMIPSLQNRDSGELLGLTTMLLLGGMAKTFKDWSYDRPGPRDLKDFLVEGFDQSGLGSWFMFANSQGEALLDIGLRPLLGMPRFDPSLRWQTSTALGANVGQLLRGGRAVGDVANYIGGGDFSSSSATNMYRLAPFNSLFYLRLHNLFKFRNTADEVFGADVAVGGTG